MEKERSRRMRRIVKGTRLALGAAKQGGALASFVIGPSGESLQRLVDASSGEDGVAVRKVAQALSSGSDETLPREWATRLGEAFCYEIPPVPFDGCRGALEELRDECAASLPEVSRAAGALLAGDPEPAVGSVAQVYFSGGLAFKVLRRGVLDEIELLQGIAKYASPALAAVGRRDAAALVQQVSRDLEAQADLRQELARLQEVEAFLAKVGCRSVVVPSGVCATSEVLVMRCAPSLQFHADRSTTSVGGVALEAEALDELYWRTETSVAVFFVASVIEGGIMHSDLHSANYGCDPRGEGSTVIYDLGASISVGEAPVSELFLHLLEERWLEAARMCLVAEEASELPEKAPSTVRDGRSFRAWLQKLQRRRSSLAPLECMCRCSVGIAHFLSVADRIGYAHMSDTGFAEVEASAHPELLGEVSASFRRFHTLAFLAALSRGCPDEGLRRAMSRILSRLAESAAPARLAGFYAELAPRLWGASLRAERFSREAHDRFLPQVLSVCRCLAAGESPL